jgi:hypothetical protein
MKLSVSWNFIDTLYKKGENVVRCKEKRNEIKRMISPRSGLAFLNTNLLLQKLSQVYQNKLLEFEKKLEELKSEN